MIEIYGLMDYAPTGEAWYEVRIMGDVTAVNVEGGVNVEILDFYNPGRGTPVYLKLNRKYCTNMESNTIILNGRKIGNERKRNNKEKK